MCVTFFFQAEDGIRDLVRSRGLGDVYKRQEQRGTMTALWNITNNPNREIDDDRAALVWRNKIKSKFAEKMKEQMEKLNNPVDFTVVASQSGDLETAKSIAENSIFTVFIPCLLYTSDAADERSR